ncbi:MAG: DNA methyltransferase, partial [Byssovorax sp.]
TPRAAVVAPSAGPTPKPWFALIWDLTETGAQVDLDAAEAVTGPWRYPPTTKFERLLRHVGIPVGLLFNGTNLRLIYAPAGESTAHLTFRVEHMRGPDGRPLLAALDLLLHARRAYSASPEHTLEGLLSESRRRQADVTDELAKQVFEAVEILLAGFAAAAARDGGDDKLDWLRPALEVEGDHFYQGVLSVVLRLVFLLYAEDQALLPVEHPTYANHLSLLGLHARLSHDVGAHPESMHHRFGAYGQLLALFRAVFFGVKHGTLELPPRRGRLFDPNTYPFLEGGQPDWTAAGTDAGARAEARPPSLDDGTVYRVLHRLVVFGGQRLSYRTLDVEQIGSIYESLMGYHVLRLGSSAVRIGKHGLWVETAGLRGLSATDRARLLKESCGLNPGPIQSIEKALKAAGDDEAALLEAISAHAVGRRSVILRHRAGAGRLVLQPGEERRRTGSHYTPRSLTDKVVRRTLEPLLACLGEERTTDQILQLKICDPAMGSGAFLVAACRELASESVAAWTRRGELARIIEKYGAAHLHARRLVAQRGLYGVDKNAAAVELAKLSLWLVTLSRQLPFTFVDHALRHGDSLVGLDFKQIKAFHWAPPDQSETLLGLLRDALDQAVELR